MAKPKPGWHVLSDLDKASLRATCAICGTVRVVYKPRKDEYRCAVRSREVKQAARKRRHLSQVPRETPLPGTRKYRTSTIYRAHKADTCSRCGFVAEHPCQLDVDHIERRADGGLHDPANLQTLCANCHRLKSHAEQQAASKAVRSLTHPTLW